MRLLPLLAAILAVAASVYQGAGPAGTAAAACGSLQAMVNATPSGGTLNVPACVYHEEVSIGRPMTLLAAPGATVDGDNTRPTGVMVQADDVTIDGLTVQRVKSDSHVGAVNLYYGARFTFRNGIVRDSSTVCLAMHAATGAKVLDSELTGCGKEGYFLNGMTNTVLARNHVHHNNMALAYDWGVEAGGGKTMDSDGVTFDSNDVDSNRGPGIWFDTRSTNATIINNKVHHNDREGIFFEIGNGARIAGNAVWNNGFGFAEWGYGAGILVSSSDHVTVTGNTVAWNARGISVISQAREFSPHDHDTVTNNVVVSAGGAPLAGFYDDHGGSLWAAANLNGGSGNRYWAGVSEPSSERFMWSNWLSTLGAYNATRGDEGGTYLSLASRDSLLGAAGIPTERGAPLPAPTPAAGDPRVRIGGTTLPTTGLVASLSWSRIGIASAYQVQVQRDGGAWSTAKLRTPLTRATDLQLAWGHGYRARLRIRVSALASGWATSTTFSPRRVEETSGALTWTGRWSGASGGGASGGHSRTSTQSGRDGDDRVHGTGHRLGRADRTDARSGPRLRRRHLSRDREPAPEVVRRAAARVPRRVDLERATLPPDRRHRHRAPPARRRRRLRDHPLGPALATLHGASGIPRDDARRWRAGECAP